MLGVYDKYTPTFFCLHCPFLRTMCELLPATLFKQLLFKEYYTFLLQATRVN